MTDDKLADEIERALRSADLRDAGYAEPRIFIKASLAEQIIAALRRSEPERSTCPLCKGTGQRDVTSFVDPTKTIKNSCSVCKGKGFLPAERQPSSDKVLELAQAQARCAELEKNSARYMWLWQETVDRFLGIERPIYIAGVRSSRDGINAAIDAALKEPR